MFDVAPDKTLATIAGYELFWNVRNNTGPVFENRALAAGAAKTLNQLISHLEKSKTGSLFPMFLAVGRAIEEPHTVCAIEEMEYELNAAHQILQQALSLMTVEQKHRLAVKVSCAGLEGDGITRANERAALLEKIKMGRTNV